MPRIGVDLKSTAAAGRLRPSPPRAVHRRAKRRRSANGYGREGNSMRLPMTGPAAVWHRVLRQADVSVPLIGDGRRRIRPPAKRVRVGTEIARLARLALRPRFR